MLGVFIALIMAGWKYFISHQAAEVIFLSTTNFLLWWFIITSAIIAVIYLVVALLIMTGVTIGGAGAGAERGGAIGGAFGGILGFLGGGALSAIILVFLAIARGLLIFGAYLAHHSLTMVDGSPEWNVGKLILGIVFFLIGLIMNKSSSSSSSSSAN